MKKQIVIFVLAVLCFTSCKKEDKTTVVTNKESDTIKKEEPVTEEPLDSVAQMKAWQAYATPGNPHKLMADEIGTWSCDMTFWSVPDGKPEKANSIADIKMILGGRYQEANYQGKMMGQSFVGRSTLAYNNASKEYTSTFIDNMGTGMLVAYGKYDDKTKTIEFKGDMVNPMNGIKTPYRELYTIVDAKTRKMEMFDVKNGKEFKSMEIIMTKKN